MIQSAVTSRDAGRQAADLVDWWRGFDDPMLTAFVERAVAQNLDLQQAAARVVQARAALSAADAALLPSAQVTGQAGQTYQSLETPIGRIGSAFPQFERSTDLYQADLGGSWEIDVFGGRDAARDAARADWQASTAAAVAARLEIDKSSGSPQSGATESKSDARNRAVIGRGNRFAGRRTI